MKLGVAFDMNATVNSSMMNGIIKAPENGQPMIDPMPNHMIPRAMLALLRQSMKAARPNIDVYIVKLEGNKAVEAWNIPGLKSTGKRKSTPARGFNVLEITEYNLISHNVHINPSTIRTK